MEALKQFESSAIQTARFLKASTGLSSAVLSSMFKMTERNFGRLLKSTVDSVPSGDFLEISKAIYKTFKMETETEILNGNIFYSDIRPIRRNGSAIVAVEKRVKIKRKKSDSL